MTDLYSALDVARYVINYSNRQNYLIQNLKLQKLLYFIQAAAMLKNKKPLFDDDILAWDCGPVVLSVYDEFKRFANTEIPEIKTYFEMPGGYDTLSTKVFDETVLSKKDRQLINSVVDYFKDYSNTALTKLIQNQKPWIVAFGFDPWHIIRPDALYDYFSAQS